MITILLLGVLLAAVSIEADYPVTFGIAVVVIIGRVIKELVRH